MKQIKKETYISFIKSLLVKTCSKFEKYNERKSVNFSIK